MDTYRVTYRIDDGWSFYFVNADSKDEAVEIVDKHIADGFCKNKAKNLLYCGRLPKERGVVEEIRKS